MKKLPIVHTIINLTQHNASRDQKADFVLDLNDEHKAQVRSLLTFNNIPKSSNEINAIAEEIANIAKKYLVDYAMIGGAPFLMPYLEISLVRKGIIPMYSFSNRESVEEELEDGTVIKKNIFKHAGFVPSVIGEAFVKQLGEAFMSQGQLEDKLINDYLTTIFDKSKKINKQKKPRREKI